MAESQWKASEWKVHETSEFTAAVISNETDRGFWGNTVTLLDSAHRAKHTGIIAYGSWSLFPVQRKVASLLHKNLAKYFILGFQIMRRRKVDEILLPYEDGVPLDPSVNIGDRIITAIELMVGKNLKQIAVVRNQRPVGMIRLEDAFKKIGLTMTEEQAGRPY